MEPFVKIKNIVKTPEYEVVEKYLSVCFWEKQYDDLFTPDLTAAYPDAVPGMPQTMDRPNFDAFRLWLRNTVKNHKLAAENCIIPTKDASVFWSIRWVDSDVYWAKRNGHFTCEIAARLTVRDGKIADIYEFADPCAFYKAIDIVLPHFGYHADADKITDPALIRFPEGEITKNTVEQNRKTAIESFMPTGNDTPDDMVADVESFYASDVTEVCPFAPADMDHVFRGVDFDRQVNWMLNASSKCTFWVSFPATLYETCDPDVFITDGGGCGNLEWSGHFGHYIQHELQMFHLNADGKLDHFRVYFNPLQKFYSMNQVLPTFPYFSF